MPIDTICKTCGKNLRVDEQFAGRKGRCPVCQTIYEIPNCSPWMHSSASNPFAEPISTESSSLVTFPATSPAPSSPSSPSIAETAYPTPSSASEQLFVRTPDLSTYGPADEKTILDWIAQGRLDDTCFVKSIASDQWLSVGAWRDETKANIEKRATALFSDPAISSNGYASEVRQSYTFGSAPVAANQTIALPTSGKALASLILGISGWLVCFTGLGGPICAIIAIVLGRNDLSRMRRGEIDSKDRWMATTGFWLGAVELIVVALAVIGFLIAIILDK